jgi:hypothetical protein
VTLRARWVTLRARWVTLRAIWVTLRARWVTLRARWVAFTEREKPRISQVTNEPPAAPAAAATADTATVPPASLWSSLCESCVPRTPPVFHARASNNKPDARFAWGNQARAPPSVDSLRNHRRSVSCT